MQTVEELAAEMGVEERIVVSYAAQLRRDLGDAAVVADRRLVQPDGPERPSTEYTVVTLTDRAADAIRTAWRAGERRAEVPAD